MYCWPYVWRRDSPLALSAGHCRVGFARHFVRLCVYAHQDKLWCEEIDCGEAGIRTICSGLRAFYATAEELAGRTVLVVANLKARKMAGVDSNGMVLCASSPVRRRMVEGGVQHGETEDGGRGGPAR